MVISLKLISSCPTLACHSLGKRAVLAVSDAKSKDGRKLRNVSLENHSQISEESRIIQDPVQLTRRNKTSKDNEQHYSLISTNTYYRNSFSL